MFKENVFFFPGNLTTLFFMLNQYLESDDKELFLDCFTSINNYLEITPFDMTSCSSFLDIVSGL